RMTTSTQAISAATPITFAAFTYSSIRNGGVSFGASVTEPLIRLIDSNRPEPSSTVQIAYTATTSTIPAEIENRNEVFITDQGSSRDSRSRAFRVRRA